ncbi:MAG: response regulator transcription factor [Gaiellales bacterium]
MRVLVVEDAGRLREILLQRLREEGYAADGAAGGTEAVARAGAASYDAIVLDIRLPDLDGFQVCRELRARGCASPILMLTARDGMDDRVRGLDTGADDYLTKPFEFPELFARLRAVIRRGVGERPAQLAVGDLRIDPAARTVRRGGVGIELTSKEFAMIEYLARHRGEVLSRERLIEAVWDCAFDGDPNIVDVYVRRLRDKIDRPFQRSSLRTVRGVGYRLTDDAPAVA